MKLSPFNNRVSLVLAILALVTLSLVRAETYGQARERALTKPNRHVNDFAGVIDAATTQQLESALSISNSGPGLSCYCYNQTAGDQTCMATQSKWRMIGTSDRGPVRKELAILVGSDNAKFWTQSSRSVQGSYRMV